jgi:hypothetical protein
MDSGVSLGRKFREAILGQVFSAAHYDDPYSALGNSEVCHIKYLVLDTVPGRLEIGDDHFHDPTTIETYQSPNILSDKEFRFLNTNYTQEL